VEAMRNYGYQVGMAFQIVDDILDFTGEQARMGKPVGSDLLHGLVTLPTLYYIESHPDDPDIRLLAEDDHDKEKRMVQLVEAIRASQAIPQSMHEAKQYVERALQLLSSHHPGKNHSALEDLAKYIVDRQM
jgi:geranylgeranyl pyrophosphate synthase